jgi:hypothetical protein
MRVGELLLQRGWIGWEPLALAIGDQAASGLRLCSLLIQRGLIDFDQASRALGELHGSAAALRRHLEGRDDSLTERLPEDIAKELVALPIGRLGTGALIVCVRDPSPALQDRLGRLLGEQPVLAVAPAYYLERLVETAYAPQELEDDELEEAVDQVDDDIDVPIDVDEPADFSIDVEEPVPRAKQAKQAKPAKKRALSVIIPTVAAPAAQTRDALDTTLASFREIDAPDWLFDVAMQYISTHWSSSLLLALRDKRAIGVRGHGTRITSNAVKTFVVDIEDLDRPGPDQDMLVTALGVASPTISTIGATHRLYVADPIGKDSDDALVDLGLLVEAITDALARM